MSDRRLTRTGGAPAAAEPVPERTRYLVRGTIAPRFLDAHALSAGDAIAFAPADEREKRAFARMIADGSIRPTAARRFWLDMPAYEAAARERERRLLPWLVAIPLLIAAFATLFYVNGSVRNW